MQHPNTLSLLSRRPVLSGTALLVGLVTGCGELPEDTLNRNNLESARSSHARITAPAVSADERAALVRGHTRFAVDAYRVLAQDPGNIVYSPHSVQLALAMAWAGSNGSTDTQIAQALRFELPQTRQHAAFNDLDQDLARRAARPVEGAGRRFRLRISNALWGQRDYRFLNPFLDTLAENYGAGVNLLDFERAPEPSRARINAAISEQTERRIPELLPEGSITSATTLVLTNAVYFNASWSTPFEASQTARGDFHRLDGSTHAVPLMNRSASLRYAEGEGWQAAEIPYVGDEVSMLVMVPTAGSFEAFERGLTADRFAGVVSGLRERMVQLTVPTFSFRKQASMKRLLQGLGMVDAFNSGAADFSRMDGTRDLFVTDVLHEGFIAVNEQGTEAAAATAVIFGRTSAPEPATLRADRPFVFAIRDNTTGAVLFLGRVVDP